MQAITRYLDYLIRGLGSLLVLMIVGFFVVVGAMNWYSSNRYEVYAECQARAIEHKVSDDIRNIHLDYCMQAKGYSKTGCDPKLIQLPACYTARWVFW